MSSFAVYISPRKKSTRCSSSPLAFPVGPEGRLRSATLTGPFYDGEPDVTYDLTIDEYDVDQEISAP